MCQGRCSGCGQAGPDRDVIRHTVSCPEFAALYREHPERALPPSLEYRRWREQDKSAEQAARIAGKVSDTDARRAVMAGRFATRDILGDEE